MIKKGRLVYYSRSRELANDSNPKYIANGENFNWLTGVDIFFETVKCTDGQFYGREYLTGELFPFVYIVNNMVKKHPSHSYYYCAIAYSKTSGEGEVTMLFEARSDEIEEYLKQKETKSQQFISFARQNKYQVLPKISDQDNLVLSDTIHDIPMSPMIQEEVNAERLLQKIRDIQLESYRSYVQKFHDILFRTQQECKEYDKSGLFLKDMSAIQNQALYQLIKLNVEMEVFIQYHKPNVNERIPIFLQSLKDIYAYIINHDLVSLQQLDQTVYYFSQISKDWSLENQMTCRRLISYLYILLVKEFTISESFYVQMKEATYFSHFENQIQVILREMVENGSFVTNNILAFTQERWLTTEELLDAIVKGQFQKKKLEEQPGFQLLR